MVCSTSCWRTFSEHAVKFGKTVYLGKVRAPELISGTNDGDATGIRRTVREFALVVNITWDKRAIWAQFEIISTRARKEIAIVVGVTADKAANKATTTRATLLSCRTGLGGTFGCENNSI